MTPWEAQRAYVAGDRVIYRRRRPGLLARLRRLVRLVTR